MARGIEWGFFGAGKMAEGILSAALAKGVDPKRILMAEKSAARAEELARAYGVEMTDDVRIVARRARAIFLAVRPQDVAAVATAARPVLDERTLLVSIVAGKSLASLGRAFGRAVRLVRVMPNLALRAREGMCALCAARTATAADVRRVAAVLDAAGRTIALKERQFDAVTALSGSGPAFFAFMERAMAAGGRALGLPAAAARLLAEQTMYGTAAYLRRSGADLDAFIAGVATPGGTTAAGMDVLASSDFEDVVARTLAAAARRSAELGT